MYKVKTKQFEGPLHLLLELIEKQEMDITKISLAEVADDFLEYANNEESVNLANLSDFLLVASQLILIKSKALLPLFEFSQEEEEEIEDLEERLKEYRRFKKVARKLGELINSKQICFSKDEEGVGYVSFVDPKISAKQLQTVFVGLLQEIPTKEELGEEIIEEVINLEEKIVQLKNSIEKRTKLAFHETIIEASDKIEIVVSFLAMLEMIKQQVIRVKQEDMFGEIILEASGVPAKKRQ